MERSIKQWLSGYLKWALNYFGLRWGIRVRAKGRCSRWMEEAVMAQNGTELGRITPSLSQLWPLRGFLWRCCTDVQEWAVLSCTWRLDSAQKLIWQIIKAPRWKTRTNKNPPSFPLDMKQRINFLSIVKDQTKVVSQTGMEIVSFK